MNEGSGERFEKSPNIKNEELNDQEDFLDFGQELGVTTESIKKTTDSELAQVNELGGSLDGKTDEVDKEIDVIQEEAMKKIEEVKTIPVEDSKIEKTIISDSFIQNLNLQPNEVINLRTKTGDKTGEVMVENVSSFYPDGGVDKSVMIVNGFIKTQSGYNEPIRIIPNGIGSYNVISSKDGTALRNNAEISR